MRTLLFYPNLYGMSTLPYALGIFTDVLKQTGHGVRLFDTTMYPNFYDSIDSDRQKADNLNARAYDDSILRSHAKYSDAYSDFQKAVSIHVPEIIIMSATEDMFPVGISLLQSLPSFSKPLVVCGGVFATFAPELAYQYAKGTIDYILKGEGEETLIELLHRLETGKDISTLPGLYAHIDSKTINNRLPKPVDITKNPFPDYSLFDESRV